MEKIVAGTIVFLTLVAPQDQDITNWQEGLTFSTPQKISVQTISTKPQEQEPKEEKIHKVEAGDSLDSVSKKYYGSGRYWTTLWNDNNFIEDPRFIKAGWELKIRGDQPKEVEELSTKLAQIYEEIISPSPTPTPAQSVLAASTSSPSSFDSVYQAAGAKYGVPWQILYGLHHMETGGRDGAITSGYGTGAQGPLQFMPGTWSLYGVDGNGDGAVDINNATDAIWGAANYIAAHGGVEQGLKSYGGDSNLVYSYARSRGY